MGDNTRSSTVSPVAALVGDLPDLVGSLVIMVPWDPTVDLDLPDHKALQVQSVNLAPQVEWATLDLAVSRGSVVYRVRGDLVVVPDHKDRKDQVDPADLQGLLVPQVVPRVQLVPKGLRDREDHRVMWDHKDLGVNRDLPDPMDHREIVVPRDPLDHRDHRGSRGR